jgi:hypothetical protein
MSSIQLDHAGRVHSLDGTVLNDQVNSSHPTPDTAGKYGVQVKVGAQRQTFQSGGPASQVTNASAQLMEPSRVGSSSPTVRLTDGRMVTPETAEVLRVQAPHLVPTEESVTAKATEAAPEAAPRLPLRRRPSTRSTTPSGRRSWTLCVRQEWERWLR